MAPMEEKRVSGRPERQDESRRLKVCHLVSSTNGARWVVDQLSWLRDHYGHDVTAVVGGANGPLIEMLKDAGIRTHVEAGFAAYDSVASVLRVPGAIWRLGRFLRREGFDVVQSHLLFAMIITRFAAWCVDVPVRLAMYASPYHLDVPRTLWMDRLMWWMDTRLIASCRYTDDLLAHHGVAERRRALIYYGPDDNLYDPATTPPLDLRAEFGWPASARIVVMIAYFYARLSDNDWVPPVIRGKDSKGFEDLIRAAPAILEACPDTRIVLVGAGWGATGTAFMDEMRQLVVDLGLADRIAFTGYRRETNAILRGADVAVQAALYENVGGVIEALMMACPTVATAVGGMVDCVRDGQTGVLVRPADPADLARGIVSLLRDPVRARLLADNGRRLMLERFSLARTCRDLDALYRVERSEGRRSFYHPVVSLGRCIVGLPVLAWFVARVAYRDFYLPQHWPIHRYRLRRWIASATDRDTYLRPVRQGGAWLSRRVRSSWNAIRRALGFRPVRLLPRPSLLPLLRIHVANRWTTLRLTATRRRIELPMYARMYRDQLMSWIGSHSPGWGVMARLNQWGRFGEWRRGGDRSKSSDHGAFSDAASAEFEATAAHANGPSPVHRVETASLNP